MSAADLQEVHDYLVAVAHRAGEMITSATPKPAGSGTKKNTADLVTETDQAVEKMVSTALKEKYPDFECDHHKLPTRPQVQVSDQTLKGSWAKKPTSPATP